MYQKYPSCDPHLTENLLSVPLALGVLSIALAPALKAPLVVIGAGEADLFQPIPSPDEVAEEEFGTLDDGRELAIDEDLLIENELVAEEVVFICRFVALVTRSCDLLYMMMSGSYVAEQKLDGWDMVSPESCCCRSHRLEYRLHAVGVRV